MSNCESKTDVEINRRRDNDGCYLPTLGTYLGNIPIEVMWKACDS